MKTQVRVAQVALVSVVVVGLAVAWGLGVRMHLASVRGEQVGWQPTHVTVTAGDRVSFRCSGCVLSDETGCSYDPDGDGAHVSPSSPLVRGAARGALVGKIVGADGESQSFVVGRGRAIVALVSGRLLLGVNGSDVGRTAVARRGQWHVSITLAHS